MFCESTATPPVLPPVLSQRVFDDAANGPQRCQDTLPVNDGTPVTVIRAVSCTRISASPGSFAVEASAGIVADVIFGVVSVVDVHSPILPSAKSNSVAVSDCEERVSPMNTLKHLPARLLLVRLRPPSKNSEVWRLCPT